MTPVAEAANQQIADKLRELADLLEQQDASPFRVNAYRRAAETVAFHPEDLSRLADRAGLEGLVALPGVGRSIAGAILEILRTGRWAQLDRLRGSLEPEQVFRSIPGVGPELARRLHEGLEVDSLEELELAANEGRLEAVPGIGRRRAAMLRATLARLLAGRWRRRDPGLPAPAVSVLLDVDREYREEAGLGRLRKIAPRRFNPSGEAWLPILHTRRGRWDVTVLYSNTFRAHDLGRIGDWVVIYFHSDNEPEGQCTVVTETRGPLEGQRVVRGREPECRTHYIGPAEARPGPAAREQSGGQTR